MLQVGEWLTALLDRANNEEPKETDVDLLALAALFDTGASVLVGIPELAIFEEEDVEAIALLSPFSTPQGGALWHGDPSKQYGAVEPSTDFIRMLVFSARMSVENGPRVGVYDAIVG